MRGPLITYPSARGGKYHAARKWHDAQALCNAYILLRMSDADSIHVQPDADLARVHSIVCRRCLNAWRKS